jgi:hypothetical protein
VKKSDINVGQEVSATCREECGQVNAREIAVDAYFPPSVRLTAANPSRPKLRPPLVGHQGTARVRNR